MLTYRVEDMTCGHCAGRIAKAVRAVDAKAQVEVDLAQHLVRIEAASADAQALGEAIADAGYTPVRVDPQDAAAAAPRAAGCCCGGGGAGPGR